MKTKLTTYVPPADFPACCVGDFYTIEHYDENGKMTGISYHGISTDVPRTCAVKAVYIDDDVPRFLWRQDFDRLNDRDRKSVLAVFPDILEKDAVKLKAVRDIVTIARKNILKHFGEVCTRCGGSGSYAQSVAWTRVCNGICHKCVGTGKQLPRLTDKKVAEIAKFFTERRQGK